jgi:NADH-quinone oxidoreductase subunit C
MSATGTGVADAPAADDPVGAVLEGLDTRWLVPRDGRKSLHVERGDARALLERLKAAGFENCTFVTAVDHWPVDRPGDARFTVVWQLLSIRLRDRVRVQCPVREDDAVVASCADLWPGAAFSERECFDLFGIRFDGHAGLRRLMMPEGYDHHPLRKDFPHQGIQPDRLYREWDAERREDWAPES